MPEIFFISDLHLGHKNILKFERSPGVRLRDFRDLNHMHETICENWCKVVGTKDKVYVLGDVAFQVEALELIRSLPGHKRLVLGNHDLFDTQVYLKYFEALYGARQLNGVWLTHVPMHEGSVNAERVKVNLHGHLHANKIDHPKYINMCCECVDYTPVSLSEIYTRIKK